MPLREKKTGLKASKSKNRNTFEEMSKSRQIVMTKIKEGQTVPRKEKPSNRKKMFLVKSNTKEEASMNTAAGRKH